ncbi:MAG: hypothetical protein JNK56_37595, partial [Myxococcales bacterium]|nr:hypothetical protein [Myxococcales bacterium]
MRRHAPAPALLLLLGACGGDPAVSTVGGPGSSGASSSVGSGSSGLPSPTASGTSGPSPTSGEASGSSEALTTAPDTSTSTSTSTSDTTTAADTSTSTGDDGTTGAPQDACAGRTPSCPGAPPQQGGGGLVAIDRCAFPMHDQDTWADQAGRVDALRQVLPTLALAELPHAEFNRDAVALAGVPGGVKDVAQAFRWNA